MSQYTELKSIVSSMDYELKRFQQRKIKVAGQRVRQQLLTVKKIADQMRKEIQEEMKGIPKREKSEPITIPSSKPIELKRQESV